MWLVGDAGRQTSNALLERTVLGGVDERVDAAAGEHQNHGKVIEPRDKSSDEIQKIQMKPKITLQTDKVIFEQTN